MPAKIFEFPGGTKRPVDAWPGVVSATVHLVGFRPEKVPDREELINFRPNFKVGLWSVGAVKETFFVEIESVESLHALLNLASDGAFTRGQGFTIADYTDGQAKLPDWCDWRNQ